MRIIDFNSIPRLIDQQYTTRFTNLLVSGCSFTSLDFGRQDFYFKTLLNCYNNIKDSSWPELYSALDWGNIPSDIKQECENYGLDWRYLTYITWPVYCRDLLGMDRVIDCSCSGAGNRHIHDSVIWALETHPEYTPENTTVVVMWSGSTRDDFIAAPESVNSNSVIHYWYRDDANIIVNGGVPGAGNGLYDFAVLHKIKSDSTRSIENYLYISGLYHYLVSRGFDFRFAWYSTDLDEILLDITKHLAPELVNKLNSMIQIKVSLGDYARETVDGSHPTARWQHSWAHDILLPLMQKEKI